MRPHVLLTLALLSPCVLALGQEANPDPVPASVPVMREAPVEEFSPQGKALLRSAQDALFSHDYQLCERRLAEAQALDPGHPLPAIFLQSLLIYELQSDLKEGRDTKALIERLAKVSDVAVEKAEAWQKAGNPAAPAQLYLGGAMGARGLGQLYQGHYIVAFKDGKKAFALLKQCVKDEPRLYNAYLGLGQFEYTSGKMAGVLQYILDLHGDEETGIGMLETCAERGDYASPSAHMFLVRILVFERPDPARAQAHALHLVRGYPLNPNFMRWSLALCKRWGWGSLQAAELMAAMAQNWDQGNRPKQSQDLGFEEARLALAEGQLKAGRKELAYPHLAQLLNAPDPALAARAKTLSERAR